LPIIASRLLLPLTREVAARFRLWRTFLQSALVRRQLVWRRRVVWNRGLPAGVITA